MVCCRCHGDNYTNPHYPPGEQSNGDNSIEEGFCYGIVESSRKNNTPDKILGPLFTLSGSFLLLAGNEAIFGMVLGV